MEHYDFDKDHKLNLNNERDLQQAVVKYLRVTDLLFTATLGDMLDTPSSRIRSYLRGYKKGICDVIIFSPCSGYNGFCLELKAPGYGSGILSKEQRNFLHTMAVENNYFCLCSNNYTEILECIIKYTHNIL